MNDNAAEPPKKPSAEIEQTELRKKVVVNELTNSVITNLPPELTEMLRAARQINNSTPDAPKKPSAEVEHSEGKKKVVVNELTNSAMTQLPPELTDMLKAARQINNKKEAEKVPPPPPKDNDALIINEAGSIFGLQVNSTTRKEVIERMTKLSKIKITSPMESIFKYDDLGIAFYFGEGGTLQEITFSYPFAGETSKGLRIEDPIKKAIDIYGPPKMKTPAGAIWDKFAVFIKDYLVTTIRLRNS
jgi:hypothetical protein